MTSRMSLTLEELVRPVVEGMNYEYVGVEYFPQGARTVLRLYIDSPDGITLDDCEQVSHQISGVLDVEDPIRGEYVLEVSSPGDDRPLFTREQFQRFYAHRVTLRLSLPLNGRRKFTGVLDDLVDDNVVLIEDGNKLEIPFDQIDKARLAPEYEPKRKPS